MNYNGYFNKIVPLLEKEIKKFGVPVVTQMCEDGGTPFNVLISTIISLRTKDEVTKIASDKLFKIANSPEQIIKLTNSEIEKIIYPAGFYKRKAITIKDICQKLIDKYNGIVPDDLDELLKFKGVGRKTANLVISMGFKKPAICVDTHVHRISNRLGIIKTPNAEKTEMVLRKILPKKYWRVYNDILVAYGQNLCRPISPFCSKCIISDLCQKINVKKNR